MTEPKKTYLGDGVYAHFDGWYIWLTTDRYGVEHQIALEPQMMTELVRLADQVWTRVDGVEGQETEVRE